MTDDLARLGQSIKAKAMNLSEWRKSRIHEHELPSGLQVKLRDVTLTDLALTGKLPDPIVDLALNAGKEGVEDFDLRMMVKNASDFTQMLDVLVELCLVEPKIGAVADDDHITLAEMPSNDKMDIFNFINREAEKMLPFREGEAEPMAVV